jgi:type IV pilus assembly protein PilV
MFINTANSSRGKFDVKPARRTQRGDTMIEVLVTVIIIAIGVLGAAALQVTTLKNLSTSNSASIAAMVVEDFSERMRANPTAALAGNYVHSQAPDPPYPNCVKKACNTTDLATYDMGSWWTQLSDALPLASGEVTRNAGSNTFVITVRWDEDRNGSTGTDCPTKSTADLECYRFNVTVTP